MENLNWYPGHMKKTERIIDEALSMVDLVCELIDARIPRSSRNPMINQKLAKRKKKKIILLNKSDLADGEENKRWKDKLSKEEAVEDVLIVNSLTGQGLDPLFSYIAKGSPKGRSMRLMIVGIPNVGKSSLINRLTKKKGAQTGNKPGVTKGKQWLAGRDGVQILDTPGILWPKFDNQTGTNLAICGAIRDEIFSIEDLCYEFIAMMAQDYPELLADRYGLEEMDLPTIELMDEIARRRGFLMKGGKLDYNRTARTVLDEFRTGKLGRISLEKA